MPKSFGQKTKLKRVDRGLGEGELDSHDVAKQIIRKQADEKL